MKLNQRLIQNLAKVYVLFALTFSAVGCSNDGHIRITLPDTHLEETPAGLWLRMFEIDYLSTAEGLKKQVTSKLKSEGSLEDEYVRANKVKTLVWKFRGHKIRQELYEDGTSWITIEFSDGIPYSKLLPDHHKKINPNRKYEHTATIESTMDQGRRLFLFGYGSRCQRISLL